MSVQTEEAQVTSASVEVDTLRVSDRQLTLRTFRQIQSKPVIDPETHELRKPIWGWVNYFWDGYEGDIHAVWQDGESLRRSPIRFLGEGRELVYRRDYGEIEKPYEFEMPSLILRSSVEELDSAIEDLRPNLHTVGRSHATVEEIYQTPEFKTFDEFVEQWNQRVNTVKEKGQLYIAT